MTAELDQFVQLVMVFT